MLEMLGPIWSEEIVWVPVTTYNWDDTSYADRMVRCRCGTLRLGEIVIPQVYQATAFIVKHKVIVFKWMICPLGMQDALKGPCETMRAFIKSKYSSLNSYWNFLITLEMIELMSFYFLFKRTIETELENSWLRFCNLKIVLKLCLMLYGLCSLS